MPVDVNFMVGGEAGQGVQSVGFILAKAFARGGYHIFADQDYESRVRGGHNFFRVRAADFRVGAIAEPVDMLLALNRDSIDLHQNKLAEGGVTVFDSEKITDVPGNDAQFSVPLERLATETGGHKLMANSVAVGAALGLIEYAFETLSPILVEHFGGGEVGENNIKAARAGYDYARQNFKGKFAHRLNPLGDSKRMLLTGNEAIALGAVAAGCKFMAAYPMTPASSIMEYMATRGKDYNLVVVPAEDEIAAVNMIIGASYAGVRAMTATSGGGFCLMVEGLGLAGITETPIVVVNAQRPGPAIGLPTRTEQGDLEFVLHASHGEFPRAVLAPASVEDCFWLTVKAFNLAEKFQLPVIMLTDHHLASTYATVEPFDLSQVTIDRGLLYSPEEGSAPAEYRRHEITRSGISPRAFPGQTEALVVTDSDEHDETGHLIEDAETRTRMMQKRLRKLFSLKKDMTTPEIYGPKKADITLIGWGSTYGAIHEAADMLNKEGHITNSLHLNELWPFPTQAVAEVMSHSAASYVVENNATGQLARLIQREVLKEAGNHILKYDGRPFTPEYIVQQVRKEVCTHDHHD